ncbi:MAG: hypothetical protein AAGG48_17675 [Planctomycetota bacterium]
MNSLLQSVAYETVTPDAPKQQRLTPIEQKQLAQLDRQRAAQAAASIEPEKVSFQQRMEQVQDLTVKSAEFVGVALIYSAIKLLEWAVTPDDDDQEWNDYSQRS